MPNRFVFRRPGDRRGISVVLLLSALLAAGVNACRKANAGLPNAPTHQYIIGIDNSASRTPTQLQEARALMQGVIGRLQNGDRLVLVETYQVGTDAARQYFDSVPSARNPGHPTGAELKKAMQFRSSANLLASRYVDPKHSMHVMTTDLLTTLQRAADYAKGSGGRRTTVVLLSDMLNSTGELDMEKPGGVPDSGWIEARKVQHRIPDLKGVCVFAIGADVRSARGSAVRRFWRQYLHSAGATYDDSTNYRNMVADPAEVRCD